MTTVHASSKCTIEAQGNGIPEDYPEQPFEDAYQYEPDDFTFEQRREQYIQYVMQNPAPKNTKPVWYELLRMKGGQTAHEGVIETAMKFIDDRMDCADFVEHGILRLLYQFDPRCEVFDLQHPPSEKLLKHARQTTLNFKYFPDEPGIDSMCTWTENHYILFTSAAYLAGQLYPDEIFSNSGETGLQKMACNKPRILQWMDMKFRGGFNEWLSHVYYDEDLTALISLYDFAEDEEIHQKAGIIIDLLLLDMALNSFHGVFGSTHGRSYENTKKWVSNEGTISTMKLLFGMGLYSDFDNMSAAGFALSKYRVPRAIVNIAQDVENAYENKQRMGFKVEEAEKWGLNYEDVESGMIFLQNEAYMHPMTVDLTMKMFDEFNWWESDFFPEFRSYRGFLKTIRKLGLTPFITRVLERDICRNMRDEPNVYTYRTPDYMLSTAQDQRAGYGGDQHHIWQATLGPDAVCFTTHPGKLEGLSPNYWTGSGMLPSAAQYKNLTIAVYDIKKIIPALYVPIRHFYTHAWLPKDKFDEVIERDGWVFARKEDGYLALRSQQPWFWNAADAKASDGMQIGRNEEDFNREIIAPGKRNIWVCQLGRKAEDGSFEDFIRVICEAELSFKGPQVEFDSPGNGKIKFGWKGSMTLDGEELPLKEYPRYDNPYVQAEYDPREIKVEAGDHKLYLNWNTIQREWS